MEQNPYTQANPIIKPSDLEGNFKLGNRYNIKQSMASGDKTGHDYSTQMYLLYITLLSYKSALQKEKSYLNCFHFSTFITYKNMGKIKYSFKLFWPGVYTIISSI